MAALFDTHCHLFMEPVASCLQLVMERSRAADVTRFLVPAVSRETWDQCAALARLPGVKCALGIHPWFAGEGVDKYELEERIIAEGAVAVGEIGLDWKCATDQATQKEVFRDQLRIAEKLSIPVSLHCRGAFHEMLSILDDYSVSGAVHAWSRDPELMERFLQRGLFISFGGAVTRKGARRARASALAVPSDRFILETDSPSIGLSGIQAGESEPSHLTMVLEAMAAIREESPEETAELAFANSTTLFGD